MQLLRSRNALRQFRNAASLRNKSLAFVPTMGALHAGHMALVEAAKGLADIVLVSIYVNPTQFAPNEDFDAYPRDEAADIKQLEAAGVSATYFPNSAEIYPQGNTTHVRVEGMSDLLEGVYRPHFFYGVCDVVARLFNHVGPQFALFGEKDFQQLQIIRRMTRDLGLDIEIVGVPTMREPDGLAMSSRNRYLSPQDCSVAPALHTSLLQLKHDYVAGASLEACEKHAKDSLLRAGFDSVDYLTIVDSQTLLPPTPSTKSPQIRVLGAAYLGKTRLIDNI